MPLITEKIFQIVRPDESVVALYYLIESDKYDTDENDVPHLLKFHTLIIHDPKKGKTYRAILIIPISTETKKIKYIVIIPMDTETKQARFDKQFRLILDKPFDNIKELYQYLKQMFTRKTMLEESRYILESYDLIKHKLGRIYEVISALKDRIRTIKVEKVSDFIKSKIKSLLS